MALPKYRCSALDGTPAKHHVPGYTAFDNDDVPLLSRRPLPISFSTKFIRFLSFSSMSPASTLPIEKALLPFFDKGETGNGSVSEDEELLIVFRREMARGCGSNCDLHEP